jgi:ribosomal protein S6--L-glutamate ligase
MKIGIISLGGKSSLALAKSCKEYFDVVDTLDLRDFEVRLTNDGITLSYQGKSMPEYDCLYLRGSYKYSLLQRAITRTMSRKSFIPIEAGAFTLGHDKFLTLLELQHEGVAIPKTHYAATTKLAKKILETEVSYPVIMKVQEGTHGKGVMIADSLKSARTILDILEQFNKPYIIQEFVETKETSDIRAIVCGEKVLAAYRRVASDGEIRANVHSGGKRVKYDIKKEEERLAVKSAKAIGAGICGVDIFHSDRPSVIEVNLSPSLYSVEEVTGIDVLKEIAKELYLKTVKFKQKKEAKINKKIAKIKKKNGNGKEKVETPKKEVKIETKIEEKKEEVKEPEVVNETPKSEAPQKKVSSSQLSLDESA